MDSWNIFEILAFVIAFFTLIIVVHHITWPKAEIRYKDSDIWH